MTIGTDTLAQDNFNRSNRNLNGDTMSDAVNTWTALSGTPTIVSNKQSGIGIARVTDNSGFANANYSVQAEQYMKGDVSYAADGVDGEIRLYARIVDANNYYVGVASSNGGSNGALTLRIQKYVSGSPTDLATIALDDDGYTTWRFDVDGTSLKLFGDGGQLTSATDSTYTSTGYAGLASTGPIGNFSSDNFIVKGTAAAGNVNVGATTDSLTLTESPATVSYDIDVSASTDSLTLTENSATVQLNANVSASVDALTLVEYAATVEVGGDTDVDSSTANLTLTEYAASVSVDIPVNASVASLSLTEYSASVSLDTNVSASNDALVITGQAATIEFPLNISASYDTLTLSTYDANVQTGSSTLTNPGATNITYNGWTATVDVL